MLNPYFTQGTRSEQNLVQNLINEQLRMYGVDIYYIPRKYITEKTIIREVVQSKFDDALPIEAYVDNYDAYSGAGDLLTKFGIESKDEVRLIISRERYENYITPLIQGKANIKLSTRPKGGDLIWFPLDDRLYEIKDIEYAKPYYQLQNLYVYELYCELFRYQDEVIATGIDEIDNELIGDESDGITDDGINTIQGYTQTLNLVGTASQATAVTGIATGVIKNITITNRGGGYKVKPSVGIGSAPVGGVTGIATVRMISGINVCNLNTNAALKSVQHVDLVNAGSGYTIAPSVRIYGGGGTGAAATAAIGDYGVGIVTVTAAGGGYVSAPQITFTNEVFRTGVTTVSAAATAVVSSSGAITAINITNAGLGYSVAPTINIAAPGTGGSGTFVFNESVTGSVSGTTGIVRSWDSTTNVLEVSSVSGTFSLGESIVGSTSGASRALLTIDRNPDNDPFADNFNIEAAADAIIDFSEQNPFGIP